VTRGQGAGAGRKPTNDRLLKDRGPPGSIFFSLSPRHQVTASPPEGVLANREELLADGIDLQETPREFLPTIFGYPFAFPAPLDSPLDGLSDGLHGRVHRFLHGLQEG
jgi:hypothetical protein